MEEDAADTRAQVNDRNSYTVQYAAIICYKEQAKASFFKHSEMNKKYRIQKQE